MQLNFKTEYLAEVMHVSFPTVYVFVVELVLWKHWVKKKKKDLELDDYVNKKNALS